MIWPAYLLMMAILMRHRKIKFHIKMPRILGAAFLNETLRQVTSFDSLPHIKTEVLYL